MVMLERPGALGWSAAGASSLHDADKSARVTTVGAGDVGHLRLGLLCRSPKRNRRPGDQCSTNLISWPIWKGLFINGDVGLAVPPLRHAIFFRRSTRRRLPMEAHSAA